MPFPTPAEFERLIPTLGFIRIVVPLVAKEAARPAIVTAIAAGWLLPAGQTAKGEDVYRLAPSAGAALTIGVQRAARPR